MLGRARAEAGTAWKVKKNREMKKRRHQRRRKTEQLASRSEAVDKMLEVLGLRIVRRRCGRKIPGVLDKRNGIVRLFATVEDGRKLVWFNDNPARPHLRLSGNGILPGSWTIFKDTDDATFSLFTEKMKKFSFCAGQSRSAETANPFYGCKSAEEVLVRCDLLGEDSNDGGEEKEI